MDDLHAQVRFWRERHDALKSNARIVIFVLAFTLGAVLALRMAAPDTLRGMGLLALAALAAAIFTRFSLRN